MTPVSRDLYQLVMLSERWIVEIGEFLAVVSSQYEYRRGVNLSAVNY